MARIVVTTLLILMIAACAAPIRAHSGPLTINDAYTVALDREWNLIDDSYDGNRTRGDLLTQDGPSLNIIRLIGGLQPGDYIVKPARKELPTPTYRADMSDIELVEFIADSLSALGYAQLDTANIRPDPFGEADGVAMQLSAVTERGLDLKGDALFARQGEQLNVMIFMAPEAHYYEAYAAEVLRIFGSARMN